MHSDLSGFINKRILIVGDIMLDEFLYTLSEKNSQEYKDVPVLRLKQRMQYLGGAANVALNIKKLNAIPYLVGTLGNDEAAKTVMEMLNSEGISNQYLFINASQKTTVKSRVFLDRRPLLRLDEEEVREYLPLAYDFLLKNITEAITNHKPHAVILQDYNKGVLNAYLVPEILKLAREHRILVCVDPKFNNWEAYREVDLFKPNKNEMDHMIRDTTLSLPDRAKSLYEKIRCKNLLVTLGSEGNFVFDGEQGTFHIPFSNIENPDVCGAGDTVIALATLALTCGFSLDEIARLANKGGHIVCSKENIQPVTLDELSN